MNLFVSLCLIAFSLVHTDNTEKVIVATFDKVNNNPQLIAFTNDKEINNKGGHVQGIQKFDNDEGSYFFMTGSSDSYAYLCVVKNDLIPKVISVNHLMDKPFKHAGGFQIYKNLLAVGIEDNAEKDKSKVCIYNISNPENLAVKPITVIERKGEPMRSTAGCVAITEYKNKILLAVGDWDTKHIDFYTGRINENSNDFLKIGSIETEVISKSGWSDCLWNPYQNINLFNIDGELYLIGMGQNQESQDIADLYRLKEERPGDFVLTKLSSKILNCTQKCSFKAAAGSDFKNGEFQIISTEYNISNTTRINIFPGSGN